MNPNVAVVTTFMCHPDEDEAMRRGLEGANFFGYSLAHYYVFGRHQPGRTDVWAEYQERRARARATTPRPCEAAREHGDRLGAKVVEDGVVRPARRDRHARTRCATTCAATRSAASTR